MLRAIKIRLYPTKQQTEYINKLLGSSRFVYNQSLNKKINDYKNKIPIRDGKLTPLESSQMTFNELGKTINYQIYKFV